MKVSQAVDLSIEYHKKNSQKKYHQGLMDRFWPNSGTIFLTRSWITYPQRRYFPFSPASTTPVSSSPGTTATPLFS